MITPPDPTPGFSQPTPELPVRDVQAAQKYYRDHLGFEIGWYHAGGGIGAVSHGDCALFFRNTSAPIVPQAFWMFAEDVDLCYRHFRAMGARITAPPAHTPWGLYQFTLTDLNGHLFYVFNDPPTPAGQDPRP